jgi:rSAM-associated Gly-rich repeat protein
MPQWNRLFKALSVVLPAGAVGASVLLALASTNAAASTNQNSNAPPPSGESVSTRLQAIRTGISDMTGSATDPMEKNDAAAAPAWWGNGGWGRWRLGWGNGGWGNGGWHNWHNWGNGGWGNGGWHNGWHNFWHNW